MTDPFAGLDRLHRLQFNSHGWGVNDQINTDRINSTIREDTHIENGKTILRRRLQVYWTPNEERCDFRLVSRDADEVHVRSGSFYCSPAPGPDDRDRPIEAFVRMVEAIAQGSGQ